MPWFFNFAAWSVVRSAMDAYPYPMDPAVSPGLFALLVFAFCVATWIFVCWIASRGSGWHRVAQRFGNPSLFAMGGDRIRFVSAQIGWANYSGVLDLTVSPSGLYIATIWFFRPYHPPLFIPWSETQTCPSPRAGLPPWLTVGSVQGFRIRFSKRVSTLLQRYT